VLDGQFRADDGTDACGDGSAMESGNAVDAVAIEQRDGRVAEACGALDKGLGQRGALEKAECRCGMKLDIRRQGIQDQSTNPSMNQRSMSWS
jgi:hypothetical protein